MQNSYFLAAAFLYFAVLLMIGLAVHRKHSHQAEAEFVMGGRSLNFWIVAISAHASDMSVWLFMAFPMSIFLFGLSQAWIAIGLLGGMFLTWQLIAPKLREVTEQYDCYTLSSFFEKRFNDQSNVIRILSAVMFVVFLTHYLSAGMIGVGLFLESLYGMNYYFSLVLVLMIVVVYTFFGGFVAVAWTDLFQGIFLLAMIILVPYIAFQQIPNWDAIIEAAAAKNISLNLIPDDNVEFILLLLLAANWGLGYFGMPHVLAKFMGSRNVSEMNKSKWIGMTWQLLVLSAAIFIGLIAIAFFPNGLESPQLLFSEMVKLLFHPFIAGIVLCAVLAASLSTIDSQMLVCASLISEDLYPVFFKNVATANKKLAVSRLSIVAIGFIALLLSLNKNTLIMSTVSYSWAGLGSSFGPLVLASLYFKSVNRYGAIAGILSGGATVMVWSFINPFITHHPIEPLIPGFFISSLAIGTVSYFTNLAKVSSEVEVPSS
jgi:sodium/proline symporter